MRLDEGIRKWAHKRDKQAFGHTEEVDGGSFLAKVTGGVTILARASLCIWSRCQLSNDTYQLFMYLTLNQDLGRSLELVWLGFFLFSFLKIVSPTLFLVFRKTETQKHCGEHKIGNNLIFSFALEKCDINRVQRKENVPSKLYK